MGQKHWKNDIKVIRETYNLLKLRHDEIYQTHILDQSQVLSNVSKSFPVVVRLTKLWPMMCSLVKETFGFPCKVAGFPVSTKAVWKSGVASLLKVHQTQNISAETLAISMEGPYHTTDRLATTCYQVGSYFFKMRYAHLASEWLLASLRRIEGKEAKDLRLEVLEHLHLAQCFKGDTKASIKSLVLLLEEFPKFNPSLNLRREYNMTGHTSCADLAL